MFRALKQSATLVSILPLQSAAFVPREPLAGHRRTLGPGRSSRSDRMLKSAGCTTWCKLPPWPP
eukprot:113472-Pyramimonas_sp.AAC.1